MQPVRFIYSNLPDLLKIPKELQNKSAEIIIWPLEEENIMSQKKRPFVSV